MSCSHCGGSGSYQDGKKIMMCPYCVTEEEIIKILKSKRDDLVNRGDKISGYNYQAIINLLPKFSVLAVMEAEFRKLPKTLVDLVRKVYDVKPFR